MFIDYPGSSNHAYKQFSISFSYPDECFFILIDKKNSLFIKFLSLGVKNLIFYFDK